MSGKKVPSMIHPVDKRGLRDPIAAALRRLHDETVADQVIEAVHEPVVEVIPEPVAVVEVPVAAAAAHGITSE